MSLDQQNQPPAGPPNYYGTPQPQQQGTSGLAVAGLVLAFLLAPIGFLLGLIAVFRTGNGRRKGRGLAIAGLIVSVLIMAGGTTLVVVASQSTLADPGCTTGKDAIINNASSTEVNSLQATLDGLNAAAAKAKHANVRAAMQALAADYQAMITAVKTGNMPAGLSDKVTTDAAAIDSLCTIGG
jgi:hypothetical protein